MKKRKRKKINYRKLIRKTGKILYGLVFAVLIIIAGLVAISVFKIPGNYKLLTVQSGSMEPSIKKGAVVVVKPAVDYQKGDVITVVEPANPKVSLTHRIFEIKEKDGKTFYVTKGDANDTPDMEERPKENVVGKVLFSVPYVGYPVSFAKTQFGLIVLIIIPVIIIIYSELINIKNEAQRLLKERKKRLTVKEKIEIEIGEEEIKIEKGLKKFWRRFKEKIKRIKK
jgi:signal peptidase I